MLIFRPFLSRACCTLGILAASVWFATPTQAASTGIPGYAVVPLSLMRGSNHATIRVSVNGQPTSLMLDTGASTSLLDSAFYKGTRSKQGNLSQDELPANLPRQITGNGLKADVGYISMQAGNTDFGKGPVTVLDLSEMFGGYNNYHRAGAVSGLLGEDILRRYGAIIDWRRRGVYFNVDSSKRMKNLGRELVQSGWTAVPMASTSGRRFTVPCTVGGKTAKLLVDTGAGFTSFKPDVVPLRVMHNRDAGSSMGHLASNASIASMVGGDYSVYPAEVEHWKIGAYEIGRSVVAVHGFPPHSLDDESLDPGPMLGLLGAEVMAANNAIIDVPGSTLYLKANAPRPTRQGAKAKR